MDQLEKSMDMMRGACAPKFQLTTGKFDFFRALNKFLLKLARLLKTPFLEKY